MAFLNFSTYEYVNKDENLTNINRKPNSRIWREIHSNNEANWTRVEIKTTDI